MEQFKIVKRISDGAFGTVYQARNLKEGQLSQIPPLVAIKQVYTSSHNLQRQLQILNKLPKHHHIVQIYSTFNENFTTNIVMERGKYDLSHWMNQIYYPIRLQTIKTIAYQILEGLNAIHQAGIIHRDLKPSNIVVRQNNKIAICDFGSAIQCTKGTEYQIEGFTRWYKCPEMLFGFRKYKYEVDIWSVGCILMEVAAGQPLFNSKSEIEQISLIAQFLGDPSPANWPSVTKMPDYNKITFKKMAPKTLQEISRLWNVDETVCSFIMKMIKYEGRPSAKQLLKDDFFKDLEPKELQIDEIDTQLRVKHRSLLQQARKLMKSG